MKKIKSFGCSLIFGSCLHDDGRDLAYVTPSQSTWPALIAKQLGMQYQCLARPGSGNLQILYNIMNHVTVDDPALFVIGWTYIDRFDYLAPHPRLVQDWHTARPSEVQNPTTQLYYKNFHSEKKDKFASLSYIKLAIDILTDRGWPFIMINHDDLAMDTQYNTSANILWLQNKISPHLHTFQGQTFIKWAKANGHKISDKAHPLETAHAKASDLMLPRVMAELDKHDKFLT